jgi:hypothetical protein
VQIKQEEDRTVVEIEQFNRKGKRSEMGMKQGGERSCCGKGTGREK